MSMRHSDPDWRRLAGQSGTGPSRVVPWWDGTGEAGGGEGGGGVRGGVTAGIQQQQGTATGLPASEQQISTGEQLLKEQQNSYVADWFPTRFN